jgi:molybdate/tungstate transport system substrate-binding protein
VSRFLALRNQHWLSSSYMTRTQGSRRAPSGTRRLHITLAAIACLGLAAAGCSSSSSSSTPSKSSKKPVGEAKVAYASSIDYFNSKIFVPAFIKATGYKYTDWVNSSGALSSDIAAKEISPNVFESVGGDNIAPLEPKFTKWYVQYAGTQMVLAYNPKSKYASQFKAIASGKEPLKDLFTLMETKGFKLGRTDPNIDPQGRSFIYMLELAQMAYHLPSDTVAKIIGVPAPYGSASSSQIYAEASLDSTLESGQLDAASAYLNQAIELHLDYIKLPASINLGDFADATEYGKAMVTITDSGQKVQKTGSPLVLDITTIGTPTPAAVAFVKYVLSPAGLALYKNAGYTLLTPTASGTGIPAAVKSELGS